MDAIVATAQQVRPIRAAELPAASILAEGKMIKFNHRMTVHGLLSQQVLPFGRLKKPTH
jgi:hypothetical protein